MFINTIFFDFSRWRPSAVRNFYCWSDRSNSCRDIASFEFYRTMASAILDFVNYKFVTVRTVKKGRTASPCQLVWKPLKPWPRYSDFLNFQNGGRRHLGLLELQISNCGTDASWVSNCNIMSNVVAIGQTGDEISRFRDFSRWWMLSSWIFNIFNF